MIPDSDSAYARSSATAYKELIRQSEEHQLLLNRRTRKMQWVCLFSALALAAVFFAESDAQLFSIAGGLVAGRPWRSPPLRDAGFSKTVRPLEPAGPGRPCGSSRRRLRPGCDPGRRSKGRSRRFPHLRGCRMKGLSHDRAL